MRAPKNIWHDHPKNAVLKVDPANPLGSSSGNEVVKAYAEKYRVEANKLERLATGVSACKATLAAAQVVEAEHSAAREKAREEFEALRARDKATRESKAYWTPAGPSPSVLASAEQALAWHDDRVAKSKERVAAAKSALAAEQKWARENRRGETP